MWFVESPIKYSLFTLFQNKWHIRFQWIWNIKKFLVLFQINKCDAFLALFNSEFIQIKKENKDNLNLFYSNYFFLNFYVKTLTSLILKWMENFCIAILFRCYFLLDHKIDKSVFFKEKQINLLKKIELGTYCYVC